MAAQLARRAASPDQYVVGSVGPTGEFLEPLGEVSQAEMYNAFVEQVTALEEGGADAVVIETMTALEEAVLAIKAAKESTQATGDVHDDIRQGAPWILYYDGNNARGGGK